MLAQFHVRSVVAVVACLALLGCSPRGRSGSATVTTRSSNTIGSDAGPVRSAPPPAQSIDVRRYAGASLTGDRRSVVSACSIGRGESTSAVTVRLYPADAFDDVQYAACPPEPQSVEARRTSTAWSIGLAWFLA